MRVLSSTYGSRGDVEPFVALAVQLQALGADVRRCAPSDAEFIELLHRAGVPMVPFDSPWRSWERPPTAEERHRRVADFIAAQHDTVVQAAAGCDVLVATAMSHLVAPSVAEQLGLPYRGVLFCPDVLGLDGQGFDELFGAPVNAHRASIGLAPVSDVGRLMFGGRPVLAADPILAPGGGPTASPSARRGRGSCPTSARSRPTCWRSWTATTRRCTSGSAACAPSGRTACGWRPSCISGARARPPRQPRPARRRWWCPRVVTRPTGRAGPPNSVSAPRTTVRRPPSSPCPARSGRF